MDKNSPDMIIQCDNCGEIQDCSEEYKNVRNQTLDEIQKWSKNWESPPTLAEKIKEMRGKK